jgi:DNA-binding transcriptional regulator GbsR (MarR family)
MAITAEEQVSKTAERPEIDSNELSQRVSVIKRFKTLLAQQKDRFKNYLDLLEKQQGVIEKGSAEDLLAYVDIEEKIVADIFSIQKVIDPLEEMYYSIGANKNAQKAGSTEEVPGLKESLEKLKSETLILSNKNKELLSKRMLELRTEIKALRNNPYTSGRRGNFNDSNTASLVDIKG